MPATNEIQNLFEATRKADVAPIIQRLETKGFRWKPVGGILNNSGAVEIGSDPAESLTERITNAIDAVLEREWKEHHSNEPQPLTPRDAAERWFKIPKGQLSRFSSVDRRKLAGAIQVTLHESDVQNSPTVSVADSGIGQHPSDFSSTLLSLHHDNKIGMHFLMGAYGQGGAAVYAFCEYTIIISRRTPSLLGKGEKDSVGWTIVRYNELDADHKNGRYEYIVNPEGEIPSFDAASGKNTIQPGTRVIMIQYSLPKYSTIFTALRWSLWSLANQVLYDPVLPFLIGDERSKQYPSLKTKSPTQRTRVIIGNTNRLRARLKGEVTIEPSDQEEDLEGDIRYDQEHTVPLGQNGQAIIRFWVFNYPKTKSKTPPVDVYADAQSSIVVTLNGQRQAKMDRTYFRTTLNLPILKDYMIVQIDCDRLSKSGKKELFSATRDRIRQGPFLDALLNEMNEIISKDPHIKSIVADLQEAALKSASTEQNVRLSRQLEELINEWEAKTKVAQVGHQMLADEKGRPTIQSLKRKDEVDEEVEAGPEPEPVPPATRFWTGKYFPTEFDFVSKSNPLRLPLGKRYTILLRNNGQDDCLTRDKDRGELSIQVDPSGTLLEKSRSQSRSGRVAVGVITSDGTSVDDHALITATLSFPNRDPLIAKRDIVFAKTRLGMRKPVILDGTPKYQIVPVVRENDQWKTDKGDIVPLTWTEDSVAQVDTSGKSVIIYVSMSNRDYIDAIRSRNLTGDIIHRYSDRYKVAIAFHTYLQDLSVREMAKENKPLPQSETLEAELQRTVRTVIFTTFVAPEQAVLAQVPRD
jgi:hypothetical protein